MHPDISGYISGMRSLWSDGDYTPLGERLAPAAAALVDVALPAEPAPLRVLDLAAGTGSAAVLAASRGATVIATDLSPRMVERGRERTAGLTVSWREADVEDLPFDDASADVAVSSFGLIFAPRPAVALAQARRVLRPAGTLAFTAWTAGGFMGRMTTLMRRWLPPADGIADVLDWGRPDVVGALLAGAGLDGVRTETRTLPWHFDSRADMTAFLRAHSPAHRAAAAALGDRAPEMFDAVERLAAPDGGPVRVQAEYLLVTVNRG